MLPVPLVLLAAPVAFTAPRDHRNIAGNVLVVQDPPAVIGGYDVDRAPGNHRLLGSSRERQRRRDSEFVHLQVGDGNRQVVAVLQHEVRLAAQLLRDVDARAAGVEVQRRPALTQERQEGLLLRWSFGRAHAPRRWAETR